MLGGERLLNIYTEHGVVPHGTCMSWYMDIIVHDKYNTLIDRTRFYLLG